MRIWFWLVSHSMDFRETTPADFEAAIAILSRSEGGRETPPHNGIRWDFCYHGDDVSLGLYNIWPYFFNSQGTPMPMEQPLVGVFEARMFIANREMLEFHAHRISVGTKFNCHEGAHIVATGVVTSPMSSKR